MRGLSCALALITLGTIACEGDLGTGGSGGDGAASSTGTAGSPNGGGGQGGGTGASGGAGGNVCTDVAAPTITSPAAGIIDVTEESLVITVAPWDPAAGTLTGLEVEIYDTTQDVANDLVWRATFDAASIPAAITLADGTWEDVDVPKFKEWEDHAVRARWLVDAPTCEASAFSTDLLFKSSDGSPYLFDDTVVRDFYFDIPQSSIDGMNAQYSPPGCVPFKRDYYPATLTFEGEVFEGVGVHIKGGCGSSRDFSEKPSLKVNIDWDDPALPGCPDGRRLLGQKHLTLNNGVQDRTASHERLAYSVFRQEGIPAPRLAHARVFVNGQLYGLYQHVESLDRRFLARWFGSNDGMLYEGTYWCDLVAENLPPDGSDDYCLTKEFSQDECDGEPTPGADPEDYTKLAELITTLDSIPGDQFYEQIQGVFDIDRLLGTWAVETITGHWDGYNYNIVNNYRVYRDPSTNLWTIIDTGVDQTFEDDLAPFGNISARLATSCANHQPCKDAYIARLKEVRDTFSAMSLDTTRAAIKAQIEPFVTEDPRKEYSLQQFNNNHQATSNFILGRPARINEHIVAAGYAP